MLTKELLAEAPKVIAIEKDPALVSHLREFFKEEIDESRLILIEGDARDDIPELEEDFVVIANIPYYITGQILRSVLGRKNPAKKITMLVQKEIAQRITNTEKESLLSLAVKLFGTPKYVKTISKRMFTPAPKVDSAILAVEDIHPRDPEVRDMFFPVLRQVFNQKRKQVGSTLKGDEFAQVREALEKEGIGLDRRPEDIPFSVWEKVLIK